MNRRTTKQRTTIQEALRHLYHPTAEEVVDAVRRLDPTIGRATVFRTLSLLCDEGVIFKVLFPDEATRYDTGCVLHDHFICRLCRRITDLPPLSAPRPLPLEDYTVESCTATFVGVCPDCRTAEKK